MNTNEQSGWSSGSGRWQPGLAGCMREPRVSGAREILMGEQDKPGRTPPPTEDGCGPSAQVMALRGADDPSFHHLLPRPHQYRKDGAGTQDTRMWATLPRPFGQQARTHSIVLNRNGTPVISWHADHTSPQRKVGVAQYTPERAPRNARGSTRPAEVAPAPAK